eukprot:6461642-Amphidinium_carterae.2
MQSSRDGSKAESCEFRKSPQSREMPTTEGVVTEGEAVRSFQVRSESCVRLHPEAVAVIAEQSNSLETTVLHLPSPSQPDWNLIKTTCCASVIDSAMEGYGCQYHT